MTAHHERTIVVDIGAGAKLGCNRAPVRRHHVRSPAGRDSLHGDRCSLDQRLRLAHEGLHTLLPADGRIGHEAAELEPFGTRDALGQIGRELGRGDAAAIRPGIAFHQDRQDETRVGKGA